MTRLTPRLFTAESPAESSAGSDAGERPVPFAPEPSVPASNEHPSAPIQVLGSTGGIGASIRRTVGQSDLDVFPLALGTSVFGWTAQSDASAAILNRYYEFGGNFIDTADSYSAGRSEHIIGNWMARRGNRDDIVIATKIGTHPDNPGLGPVSMVRAVEASLERLQTDHIDLLYFHLDDRSVPLEDSLGTAQWLIETGKVRYLGASNFSAERLVEARILSAAGYPRFEALETHYSLMHRRAFEGDLELVSRGQALGVMPYFGLENGFLTGKYRSRADLDDSARSARVSRHLNRNGLRVLRALDLVAHEQDAPVAAVALAWLLSRSGVTAPVASASRPEQIDALVQASAIRLTRSQVVELERATRV
ncbi:aldo/keto reductase [Mycetocola zhadangensis]|uniref:Aldo/keto reductase n=1 Tax=Mycetocola zhadangensis TaxID=1164595 RepID=A0A3L7ISU3_9MICO|nr:aldo/keto reductase [Mycetocola zhadangensis]RLQ81308.1 aldo/keto reductase [Mycetocola zhadangensis]GGF02883.1 NADP-dependent aryl-alcohol dehydrogenase [Mycetocola zhadangensis]